MNRENSHQELREANVGSGKLQGKFYLLEQTPDCLQSLFCCFCQGDNEYSISETDPNFNVASKKGYIKQKSDCIARVCCVCNRPFEATLKLFNQDVAFATRACKCCLQYMPCLENEIVITNKGGRVLGYLRVGCWFFAGTQFACADAQIQVLGENEQLIYRIEGSYCQKSIFCPCFRCCYCPLIEYHIFDNLNLKVGKINNIYNGCFQECFSRADKFGIEFPGKADQDQKILLTFGVMYLDYLRYETPFFCLGVR